MKTHYYPTKKFTDDDHPSMGVTVCGRYFDRQSNIYVTIIKKNVTCKQCVKISNDYNTSYW